MKKYNLNTMIKISLLSAIATVLMLIEIPYPFAEFLKLDISDLPAVIGAFAFGPLAGIIVELLKNVIHYITATKTGGVGEFANFLIGASFVLPAGLYYLKNKTKNGALIGMALGVVSMCIMGIVANYFVIFPMYGWPISINNLEMIIYTITPFNLIKGIMITLLTIFVYKRISRLLANPQNTL